MSKEEIVILFGNVLTGIACPFLFLLYDNPFKTLCGITLTGEERQILDELREQTCDKVH